MRWLLPRFLAVFLLLAGSAAAHPSLQNSLWVMVAPDRVRVAINVSVRELLIAQSAGIADFENPAAGEVPAAVERHRDYVLRHLQISADGQMLGGQVTKVTAPAQFTSAEETFYQYEIDYPVVGSPPARLTLRHEMLREWPYAPGQSWDVTYVVRVKRSDSNEITTGLLAAPQAAEFFTGWEATPPQDSRAKPVPGWRIFRDYLAHGVMHILTGYDHLLFVSALVLATLNFWEMVKVIAAFTLAHTITLALSVFDIFRLPPTIVEPVIALSIVFVALENVLFPQRAHSRVRLAVAFGFGLIHGLGFAGGLLEAMEGLPPFGTWIALGAFSLGVEIGHQAVVLPLFGLLALGRGKLRDRFQLVALRSGSVLISLCGVYYLFISVQEQFFTK